MRHYGIIGMPLEHSYSARYFTEKFAHEKEEADYCLYPISDIVEVEALFLRLDGFNVTFPYKQAIFSYLTRVDEVARAIGAVNVVHGRTGYNTDWVGFVRSLRPLLLPADTQALILGTGGVSKAVEYGLKHLGIASVSVSRTRREGVLTYEDLTPEVMQAHPLIVNCTPLGMFPDVASCPPIPYKYVDNRHLLFDCVYNPEQTEFLRRGAMQGARTQNGLQMLYYQADAAWQIWNQTNKL